MAPAQVPALHWCDTATPPGLYWYCTGTVLALYLHCTASALLPRCDRNATAMPLQCLCNATAMLLQRHCTRTTPQLHWNCTGTPRVLHRYFPGAVAVLYQFGAGTVLVLYRTASALVLHRCLTSSGLVLLFWCVLYWLSSTCTCQRCYTLWRTWVVNSTWHPDQVSRGVSGELPEVRREGLSAFRSDMSSRSSDLDDNKCRPLSRRNVSEPACGTKSRPTPSPESTFRSGSR